MWTKPKLTSLMSVALATAQLAACGGGGGGGGGGGNPAVTITGVAALGAPLVGATVKISDASGTTRQASSPSGADGSYSVDATGLTAPMLVEVSGEFGGEPKVLHSIQGSTPDASGATVNVTPLTDVVVAKLYGANPADTFTSTSRPKKTADDVANAVSAVSNPLASVMTNAQIANPSAINLVSTTFSADGTGLDRVLDNLSVTKDDSTGAFVITNRSDPRDGLSLDLAGGTLSGSLPTTIVDIDSALTALASSLTAAYQNCSSTALAALFDASYLHDSTTNADMTNASGDICKRWKGATFSGPTLEPQPLGDDGSPLTLPTDERMLRFSVKLTNGFTELFVTRAAKVGGSWKLLGNGSKYRVQIVPTDFTYMNPADKITADVPAASSANGLPVKYVTGLAVQSVGGFVFNVYASGKDNTGPATQVKSATIEVYKQGAGWQTVHHRLKPPTYSPVAGSPYSGQPTKDNLNNSDCPGGWLGFGHPDRPNCANKLFADDTLIQNMPATGIAFRITLYAAKEATGSKLDTRYLLVPPKPAPSGTVGALPIPKLCPTLSADCLTNSLNGINGFDAYTPTWVNVSPAVLVQRVVAFAYSGPGVGNQVTNAQIQLGASSAPLKNWIVISTGAAATAPVSHPTMRRLVIDSVNASNGMRNSSFISSNASDAPLTDEIAW